MKKEFIGRSAKILVNIDNKTLFYTAKQIYDITETHIYFYDKFHSLIGIRKQDVLQFTLTD